VARTVVSVLPATLISSVPSRDPAIPHNDDSLKSPGEASNGHPDEFQSPRRICAVMREMLMCLLRLFDILGFHGYSIALCFEITCFEGDVVLIWFSRRLGCVSVAPSKAADRSTEGVLPEPPVGAISLGGVPINDRWEDSKSSVKVDRDSV
jgi:hypothetical protein